MHIPRNTRRLAVAAIMPALIASSAVCYRQVPDHQSDPEWVPLVVSNDGFFDVNVYAVPVAGTAGVRIGTVTGFSSQILHVREHLLQSGSTIVLRLHAIGTSAWWDSPALFVDNRAVARLDVRSEANGDMHLTALYLRNDR